MVAQQVAEHHQRQRGDRGQYHRARRVAEHEAQGYQRRDVQPQDPEHEPVAAPPILFGQVVAVRKGVEELSPHRAGHHFSAHTRSDPIRMSGNGRGSAEYRPMTASEQMATQREKTCSHSE